MAQKEPKNCWEFMECPKKIKEKCIVYKLKVGRECWLFVDFKTGCPGAAKKHNNSCMNCPWYKNLAPREP